MRRKATAAVGTPEAMAESVTARPKPAGLDNDARLADPPIAPSETKTTSNGQIHIGCAGWSIPKERAVGFPAAGSHLQRYAGRLSAVEINSSFYRPHRPSTYGRWADSVPSNFRFAVKMPREITHLRRLENVAEPLGRFLGEISPLAETLGPVLAQLPPSLPFDKARARGFFTELRAGFLVSWFASHDIRLGSARRPTSFFGILESHASRPTRRLLRLPPAPGGWTGLAYYRLHGSPEMYYSSYSSDYLAALAVCLNGHTHCGPVWCIFDNTARGHATDNALELLRLTANASEVGVRPAVQ